MKVIQKILVLISFAFTLSVHAQNSFNIVWINHFDGLDNDKEFSRKAHVLLRDKLFLKCQSLCDSQLIDFRPIQINLNNSNTDTLQGNLGMQDIDISQVELIISNNYSMPANFIVVESSIFEPQSNNGAIYLHRIWNKGTKLDPNYRNEKAMDPLADKITNFLYAHYNVKFVGIQWNIFVKSLEEDAFHFNIFKDYPQKILNALKIKSTKIDQSETEAGANAFLKIRIMRFDDEVAIVMSEIRDRKDALIALDEQYVRVLSTSNKAPEAIGAKLLIQLASTLSQN